MKIRKHLFIFFLISQALAVFGYYIDSDPKGNDPLWMTVLGVAIFGGFIFGIFAVIYFIVILITGIYKRSGY